MDERHTPTVGRHPCKAQAGVLAGGRLHERRSDGDWSRSRPSTRRTIARSAPSGDQSANFTFSTSSRGIPRVIGARASVPYVTTPSRCAPIESANSPDREIASTFASGKSSGCDSGCPRARCRRDRGHRPRARRQDRLAVRRHARRPMSPRRNVSRRNDGETAGPPRPPSQMPPASPDASNASDDAP